MNSFWQSSWYALCKWQRNICVVLEENNHWVYKLNGVKAWNVYIPQVNHWIYQISSWAVVCINSMGGSMECVHSMPSFVEFYPNLKYFLCQFVIYMFYSVIRHRIVFFDLKIFFSKNNIPCVKGIFSDFCWKEREFFRW